MMDSTFFIHADAHFKENEDHVLIISLDVLNNDIGVHFLHKPEYRMRETHTHARKAPWCFSRMRFSHASAICVPKNRSRMRYRMKNRNVEVQP